MAVPLHSIWLILLLALVSACARLPVTTPPHTPPSWATQADLRECLSDYATVDVAVRKAGVRDREAAIIPDFPYLRVNRLLASYTGEVDEPAIFSLWVDHLQGLASEGWTVELANLPGPARQDLRRQLGGRQPATVLGDCAPRLRQAQLEDDKRREALRQTATVPDDYRGWQRIVGLYPLTALAFELGIERWQAGTLAEYAMSLNDLPVSGRLIHYVPGHFSKDAGAVAPLVTGAQRDALGIPRYSDTDREQLFAAHAPRLSIDTWSDDDRPGQPRWASENRLIIDTENPMAFRRLNFTRVDDQVLTQLVYTLWFPARTASGSVDLLAGKLDGLIWRVTLGPDGRPWVYDSIHACGCYHLLFPVTGGELQSPDDIYQEQPLLAQHAPTLAPGQRLWLRIAAGTHYIQRLYAGAVISEDATTYAMDEAMSLRSLSLPAGGQRSLYGEDALVAGSERGERLLFWPMGIPSPGAMRQWGHHAIAFVGRRHFDDAYLLQQLLGHPRP